MIESVMLGNLKDFLLSKNRENVFLSYLLKESAPSDIADTMKIPISTVDRITSSLRLLNIIKKTKESERKNYYTVDWHLFISENLKIIGLGYVEEETIEKFEKAIKDSTFFCFRYLIFKYFIDFLKLIENLSKKEINIDSNIIKLLQTVSQTYDLTTYPAQMVTSPIVSKLTSPFMDKELKEEKKVAKQKILDFLNKCLDQEPIIKMFISKFNDEDLTSIVKNSEVVEEISMKLFEKFMQKQIKPKN